MIALFLACVLDRTGQSATGAMRRELTDHNRRVRELEVVGEDVARRISQLEELSRAEGQNEILKMETMEQLRQEVANMRGELDTLHHDYTTYEEAGLGFQTDVDYRLGYLETRVVAIEKSLGLKPPPAPNGATVTTTPTAPPEAPPDPDLPETTTPEQTFELIAKQLEAGNNGVARAVAQRFIAENPKSDRVVEAHYRVAESYQNGGDYKMAAAAFQEVIDEGPDSAWAAWSMLRQGECFDALGSPEKGRIFYCDVVRLYPKSKAAKEAKAKCGK